MLTSSRAEQHTVLGWLKWSFVTINIMAENCWRENNFDFHGIWKVGGFCILYWRLFYESSHFLRILSGLEFPWKFFNVIHSCRLPINILFRTKKTIIGIVLNIKINRPLLRFISALAHLSIPCEFRNNGEYRELKGIRRTLTHYQEWKWNIVPRFMDDMCVQQPPEL